MGQFHSDFPLIKGGSGEIPVSIHSIFIAKKVYLDVLTDSSGKIDYMIRGKGLTQASIKAAASRYTTNNSVDVSNETESGLVKLYKAIYNGEKIREGLKTD